MGLGEGLGFRLSRFPLHIPYSLVSSRASVSLPLTCNEWHVRACWRLLRRPCVGVCVRVGGVAYAPAPWACVRAHRRVPACVLACLRLRMRAHGGECACACVQVSSADLTSKWLGESEKLVKALFQTAREKKFASRARSITHTRARNHRERVEVGGRGREKDLVRAQF